MIPTDLPFNIDNETGEVTTKKALDYESQKVWWTQFFSKLNFINVFP